jgi:hypothetical protein
VPVASSLSHGRGLWRGCQWAYSTEKFSEKPARLGVGAVDHWNPANDEWASELANRTVHAVMHLSWVPDDAGGYRGQMAVLVKPNGLFGWLHMAVIASFRHLFVYPPLMRDFARVRQADRSNSG